MPKLDDMRYAAREADYGNHEQEDAAIQATDAQVFDRVRAHEARLKEQGETMRTDVSLDTQAAFDIAAAFATEVTKPLDTPTYIDPVDLSAVAARHQQLVAMSNKAIRSLEAQQKSLDWMIRKLESPYADLDALLEKFPQILR